MIEVHSHDHALIDQARLDAFLSMAREGIYRIKGLVPVENGAVVAVNWAFGRHRLHPAPEAIDRHHLALMIVGSDLLSPGTNAISPSIERWICNGLGVSAHAIHVGQVADNPDCACDPSTHQVQQ